MKVLSRAAIWNLDIDRYLNRIVPASPLHKLPSSVSRFLGYRKEPKQDGGDVMVAFWSLLGAFCGLAVIAGVFNNTKAIQAFDPPALIGSFSLTALRGASAILTYNAVRSPLGQPRNALLGHVFSSLIGVGISKLFQLRSDYEEIKWLAGALACGCASAVMVLTGTVHPPGGASAVLACIDPKITAIGWYFVGLIMWGTTLMLAVGLVLNNIARQFPIYWWTPMDLRRAKKDLEMVPDDRGAMEEKDSKEEKRHRAERIEITGDEVTLPGALSISKEEIAVLERLRDRLRDGLQEKADERQEGGLGSTDSTNSKCSLELAGRA